jgi:hypothetical protein
LDTDAQNIVELAGEWDKVEVDERDDTVRTESQIMFAHVCRHIQLIQFICMLNLSCVRFDEAGSMDGNTSRA